MSWDTDYRRAYKDFVLSEGNTNLPEIEALIQNVDLILNRLSPRTKKDKRNIEVARHNLKQIRRKYRREKSKLSELQEAHNECSCE